MAQPSSLLPQNPSDCGLWIANCGLKPANPKSLPCRQAGEIRNPKSPIFQRYYEGQAILEYVVIVTVVVLAFMYWKSSMHDAVTEVYNQSTHRAENAAVQLRGMSW